jgi:hypothetical protein
MWDKSVFYGGAQVVEGSTVGMINRKTGESWTGTVEAVGKELVADVKNSNQGITFAQFLGYSLEHGWEIFYHEAPKPKYTKGWYVDAKYPINVASNHPYYFNGTDWYSASGGSLSFHYISGPDGFYDRNMVRL